MKTIFKIGIATLASILGFFIGVIAVVPFGYLEKVYVMSSALITASIFGLISFNLSRLIINKVTKQHVYLLGAVGIIFTIGSLYAFLALTG
ncbi:MAG: hypothetical protein ACRBHB_05640 [Arenicella sp.]